MKKVLSFILISLTTLSVAACSPSKLSSEESSSVPEEAVMQTDAETISLKDKPTIEYVIPEDAPTGVAGGPGMMETQAIDDSYYPEGKRSGEESAAAGTVVCLYQVDETGVIQTMSEVSEVNADTLIAAMVEEGILAEDTEITAYSAEGTGASLELNKLSAVYGKAKEEQILACVANSFIENLELENISIKTAEKDYGVQEYTSEYDAT